MSRELAIKALLLIPLLTLSTGLLGPDLNLVTQRFATSDHVSTDIPELQGTNVSVLFGFDPSFNHIFGCLVTFARAPPASSSVICKLTDQEQRGIAFGIALANGTATQFGIQTNRNATTGAVITPFTGIDIQLIDDVKVIVFNAQLR